MSDFIYVASKLTVPIQISSAAGSAVVQPPPREIPYQPPGQLPTYPGGYAITKVHNDVWKTWLALNWNSDAVLNHLIHGEPDWESCVAFCFKHSRIRSGIGPIRVGNPVAQAGRSR